MNKLFLKAKHWQLFILMMGIPLAFQVFVMREVFSNISSGSQPDLENMFYFFKFFPIMMVVSMTLFFGWLWAMAIGLQQKIPEHVNMKVKKFKIFFFIPIVYISSILALFTYAINGFMQADFDFNPETIIPLMGGIFAVIIPLHLFSLFCILYSFYFAAKTIKTVELQQEVKFSDFVGEFFLIWFYYIGVWILQPKFNKMVKK